MPRLSVVIPTLQRPHLLSRVLDRLERQARIEPATTFDAVVVSDAAEPDTGAVARAIGRRSFTLRHLIGETPGVAATRDLGWREAPAPLVLFLGDDMLPCPDLVAEHLAWHESHPEEHVGVLGHVRWSPELRTTPFMRWLDQGMQFDYPNIEGIEAGWGRFYACNASVKRALLERAGGFDHGFRFGYEELDLARRMHDLGFRLLYNRAAVVEHHHLPTLEGWRARMRVVAGAERQFVEKYPDVEPYFFNKFSAALKRPREGSRSAALAGIVPHWMPWLGERARHSAEALYLRELAEAFLESWEQADRQSTNVR